MKKIFVILFLALTAGGCVSKSTANAQARAAYLAGENTALENGNARTGILVLGDVQNHLVPWVEGLTLAQAIATADYTGLRDPKEIILQRQGETGRVNAKDLLHGKDVPLEPGDVITVNEH